MSDRTDINIETLKGRLIARQAELRKLVAAHHEDTRPVQYDQTVVGRLSRMDEIQNQAMSAETERRRKDELHRIEAALVRMQGDDFGYCLNCGEEIEKKRIELDPAIPTCIGCAR